MSAPLSIIRAAAAPAPLGAPPELASAAPIARAVIIEVGGAAAGLVAADGVRYRFHAAARRFQSLDGQIFRTPGEAERAARAVLSARAGRDGTTIIPREKRS